MVEERKDSGTTGGLTKQDEIILFTFSARASRSLALNSFNFDMLNAISFQLGCLYSGQTAVAFGKLMGGTSLLMRLISGSWRFVAVSHHQASRSQEPKVKTHRRCFSLAVGHFLRPNYVR